jgi:putative flippase GtrA
MSLLLRDFTSPRFAKFLIAGGVAAAANFLSRMLFSNFMSYAGAILLAYVVGMVVAFLLMKLFVFEMTRRDVPRQIALFTLVNLAAVLQTLIISLLFARIVLPAMGVRSGVEEFAHLIGICVPIITSFWGHKYISFK